MDYKELILQYADSLRTDLTWASKTHINMLTMLAAENKAAAASICATIERHILSAAPSGKLPTLYLIDSIVKNVKEPYIGLFCRNLIQVFSDCWKQREVQAQLLKLLAMWEGIFPSQLLNVLKQRVKQAVPDQPTASHVHSAPAHSSLWAHIDTSQQRPVSSHTTNMPSTSGRNGYYAAPQAPYQTGQTMSASYQQPQRVQQHHTGFHPAFSVPQDKPPNDQASWQPHQVAQQARSAGHLHPSQQPSCQPLVLPNLLSSLLSSGLLTVPPSVSISPAGRLSAAPAVSYTHPPSRAGTPETVGPDDCKFVPSRLKVLSWPSCHRVPCLSALMESAARLLFMPASILPCLLSNLCNCLTSVHGCCLQLINETTRLFDSCTRSCKQCACGCAQHCSC